MCSLSLPCFLSSPPDSGSAPLTRPGLPPLRGGLTDSNASHDGANVQPHKKINKEKCLRRLLSHITSCHYSAKPGPVNKQRLHLAAETHASKRKCDNLTRGMYKIALNYSIKTNHLPSRTEERAAPRLTIRVLSSSTLLIGACHHSNIPLSWIMEKICVKYCV